MIDRPMENVQNSAHLLDDVDLFSNTTTTNDLIAYASTPNRSARINSLIDAPVPDLRTDKLIDWSGFYTTTPPTTNNTTTTTTNQSSSALLLIDTNFVEQWPEVASVNVEHRIHHMSSTSSTSSQKDQPLNSTRQNGPSSVTTRPNGFFPNSNIATVNYSPNKDLVSRCDSAPEQTGIGGSARYSSKGLNTSGLALPPKIEQRKLGSAPPIGLPNGYTSSAYGDSHVRYQKLSSTTFDQYGEELQNPSSKDGKKEFQLDNEEEEEDDEVFLHMGSAGERASVLGPLISKKKKVRFFEDGQMESELLVGSLPASASNNHSAATVKKGRSWRSRLIELTLVSVVLLALSAIVLFLVYVPLKRAGSSGKTSIQSTARSKGVCENMNVEYFGNISVDGVYPTSALTIGCLKGRDCKDTLIFGYGSTDAVPCYGSSECRGGVAAIDMATGDLTWRRPALGEINGVNCRDDLNGDGIADCLASGKRGVLAALNGKTGEQLWEADTGMRQMDAEFFMPQLVPDMDNDGVPEVLATMRGEAFMRLYYLNGKSGKRYMKNTPVALSLQNIETSVPSMIWKHGETLPDVVISVGSFDGRGGVSVYAIQSFLLMQLEKGKLIYNNSVLTPPVFADVDGDSYGDMIFCSITGEVVALNGASAGNVLWKFKTTQAECVSPLVLGFYNGDSTPDVVATFCFGRGFPMYRYCETIFIDGTNGQELKDANRIRSTLPSTASGLSIRTNSKAGDVFLIWKTTCGGLDAGLNYRFTHIGPSNWNDFSWANICQQLTGKATNLQLLAVSPGMATPTVVFDTGMRNFNEEKEKFVSLLDQQNAAVMSYVGKGQASVRIGPAGAFTVGVNAGVAYLDLILPTFVSVAVPMAVVSTECYGMNDNPELCGNQFDRMTRQSTRMANIDSGGLLLHKIRLRCSCSTSKNANCADIISENRYQPWSEYLGSNSDGRYLV